jgi:hypothetical protein
MACSDIASSTRGRREVAQFAYLVTRVTRLDVALDRIIRASPSVRPLEEESRAMTREKDRTGQSTVRSVFIEALTRTQKAGNRITNQHTANKQRRSSTTHHYSEKVCND